MFQLAAAGIFLHRKGFSSRDIWQGTQPMFAIWLFLWPVYVSLAWLWVGLLMMVTVLLSTALLKPVPWQDLQQAWSGNTAPVSTPLPYPPLCLWLSLLIVAVLFESGMPEFGLGLGLVAVLAFPLAALIDRLSLWPMGIALHPEHTLAGHMVLVLATAVLCAWSIHAYHGIDWYLLFPTSIMAGCLASLVRMTFPQWWNLPLAILSMALMLWYL
ncbi:MAG: hypothetical protein Q9M22_06260 [Mariprofundaceae bacterium]|nr:hypothetical protein [Mariprofundaceae bacterium]